MGFLDEVNIQIGCPGIGLEVLLGKDFEFLTESFLAYIGRVADDDIEAAPFITSGKACSQVSGRRLSPL